MDGEIDNQHQIQREEEDISIVELKESDVAGNSIGQKKEHTNAEEEYIAKLSNERRIKSEAIRQIRKQLQRLKDLRVDPVTTVFVIKDVKKNRKSTPKFTGFGSLFERLKDIEPLLNQEELRSGGKKSRIFPSIDDVCNHVPLITPSKLQIGPGFSKKISETQKKRLEQPAMAFSNDTLSIDIDSPVPKTKVKRTINSTNNDDIIQPVQKTKAKKPTRKTGLNTRTTPKNQSGLQKKRETVKVRKDSGPKQQHNNRKKVKNILDAELLEGVDILSDEEEAVESQQTPTMVCSYEQIRNENLRKNQEFLRNLNFLENLKEKPATTFDEPDLSTSNQLGYIKQGTIVYIMMIRIRTKKVQETDIEEEKKEIHDIQPHIIDLQDLNARIDHIEPIVEDVLKKMNIPLPVLQRIGLEKLESWQNDDKTFVPTNAASHILHCIESESFVIVTGNSGIGKTSTVRHAALQLQKRGYTIVPTRGPEDMIDVYNKVHVPKTVFIIDDLCGRYTLNQHYLENLKLLFSDITILLETCKIIATCRLQVFKDERFRYLSDNLKYTECNMNSAVLCLTDGEKNNLTNAYIENNKDEFVKLYKEFDCFPFLCKMLNGKALKSLPPNPFHLFKEEFDNFKTSGEDTGKYKYCALFMIVMFNNRLNEKYLNDDESTEQTMIEKILVKCTLNRGTSLENILNALMTLDGSLVAKDKDIYSIIHDKMFDYLANYFGNDMLNLFIKYSPSEFIRERFIWKSHSAPNDNTEFTIILSDDILDDYINRIIDDWTKSYVVDVFCNRNMKNPDFIERFIQRLRQLDTNDQLQLATMIDHDNCDTSLLLSCFVGNIDLTEWILDCHIKGTPTGQLKSVVEQCRCDGTSPVYIACHEGSLEILNKLIECKADINKCCDDGASSVNIACHKGHLEILNRLIECGADINKCCDDGTSSVYIASQNGHLEILNRLIECKADIHKCNNDDVSPVFIACQEGHLEILNRLMECEADINKCTNDDVSPVYIACHEGHLEILNRLIECGADINKCCEDDASPVYIACQKGHLEILNRLIECGADINKCCEDDASPVYIACQKGHLEILNRLIECGADINKCCEDDASPVFIACHEGSLEILNRLIECKADINKCNNNGESPVYIACQNGHLEILNRLIECKADINKCCDDGMIPLDIALAKRHSAIVKRLNELQEVVEHS